MTPKFARSMAFFTTITAFSAASIGEAEALPLPQCGFKTNIALMCSVGEIAADIYQAFGTDIEKIKEPYSQRVIHESGCIVVYDAGRFQKGIQRIRSVRIPERDGSSIRALMIDADFGSQHYDMYVADNYLKGTCPRFVIGSVLPLDTDQIQCENKAAEALVRRGASLPDSISNEDYEVAIETGGCGVAPGPSSH